MSKINNIQKIAAQAITRSFKIISHHIAESKANLLSIS